jgi:hypothetical protein
MVDIYFPEKKLVIECDGPSHYDDFNQENFGTRHKRTLLEQDGDCQVLNISYLDWDQLSNTQEKQDFLRERINALCISSPPMIHAFKNIQARTAAHSDDREAFANGAAEDLSREIIAAGTARIAV